MVVNGLTLRTTRWHKLHQEKKIKRAKNYPSISSVLDELVRSSDKELEQIQSVKEINVADILSDE